LTSDRAQREGDEIALELDALHRGFRDAEGRWVDALQDVSLTLKPGEVLGLVGPDGAGKTTLLRIAAGLLEPDSGVAIVLGLDTVRDTIELRSRIGYMPQKFGLYTDLTVRENMDLYADLQATPADERPDRYERLLEMTGLAPFKERLAGNLSGGMKQKLGLACALIKSPGLLLLDEPTVGVDPVSRRDLWEIVYRLVEEDGIGVLLSTAYLDEAERCHRVAVMFDGEITDRGDPAEFTGRMSGLVRENPCRDERQAREIQARVSMAEGVADATIVSGRVRVTLSTSDGDEALTDAGGEPSEVEPRFEDYFMHAAFKRAEAQAADAQPGAGDRVMSSEADAANETDEDSEVLVRVRDLVRRFGDFEAVKGVDFDVVRGEIFGLLGPNGAGKSTTFRMLCGLLPASEGELSVAGRDLRTAAAKARERLGYMAQHFSLYAHLSARENLRFFGRAYGLLGRRMRRRLHWALEEFELSDRADQPAGSLPGGYKQRLAMAAALIHEPDILFLDEPTSGVDPLARREFWRRINAVARSGVTVIVTTHFMEEAEYCDRMLIMSRGEPLALGRPQAIRALARDDNRPDPTIEDAFIALSLGEVDPAGTPADPAASREGAAA